MLSSLQLVCLSPTSSIADQHRVKASAGLWLSRAAPLCARSAEAARSQGVRQSKKRQSRSKSKERLTQASERRASEQEATERQSDFLCARSNVLQCGARECPSKRASEQKAPERRSVEQPSRSDGTQNARAQGSYVISASEARDRCKPATSAFGLSHRSEESLWG